MSFKTRAIVAVGMLLCALVLCSVRDWVTALLAYGVACWVALGAVSNYDRR